MVVSSLSDFTQVQLNGKSKTKQWLKLPLFLISVDKGKRLKVDLNRMSGNNFSAMP